ncbi:uncharacterized protein LOC122873086 isoform X2 [Siniperca chuatsi]|uniref:uncharacterized protein LOC122873086 isoform X2 n=1 Tax=Siniperca chuatsi TaxID=119488 RepID=UPI001CE22260|nr:uncharacterized protein LOC122873086 isoform X2 [Siniperca chuatsi]
MRKFSSPDTYFPRTKTPGRRRATTLEIRAGLAGAADGEPHDCVAVITETCSPRPDLQETPLINPELELFVDGSASRDPATDSRYAWGVAHDFGKLWANRNFLTSTGKPIAHHTLVAELLDAVLLPKQIAICKCEAHTNNLDPISQGNARADKAAKAAAKQTPTTQCVAVTNEHLTPTADLQELQTRATAEEKAVWRKAGCTVTDKVW